MSVPQIGQPTLQPSPSFGLAQPPAQNPGAPAGLPPELAAILLGNPSQQPGGLTQPGGDTAEFSQPQGPGVANQPASEAPAFPAPPQGPNQPAQPSFGSNPFDASLDAMLGKAPQAPGQQPPAAPGFAPEGPVGPAPGGMPAPGPQA